MAHPQAQIPEGPHGKARYESAKRHAEAAKAAGKSSEEIHAIFKQVMEFNPETDLDKLPNDGPHGQYKSAYIHAKNALANGKSTAEAHELFKKIKAGEKLGGKHADK